MRRGKRAPLEAGGAGLPEHERLVGDLWIRGYASFASPASILRVYRAEAGRMLAMSRRVSPELGRQPVSIRRFPGIEADSRHWSLYMTLDHLVLVNTAITALMHAICADHNPGVEIRLEDVEPHADAGQDRVLALKSVVDRYSAVVARLGSLRARERYPHPWFGELTARQWHAVAALHNRIHRIHVQQIIRKLGVE